jgi:hypothetical protein
VYKFYTIVNNFQKFKLSLTFYTKISVTNLKNIVFFHIFHNPVYNF